MKASLRCAAKAGPATWSLVDPAGAERWSGSIKGSLDVEQSFAPIPGIWRFRFKADEYTGFYAIEISGRGGAKLRVEIREHDSK